LVIERDRRGYRTSNALIDAIGVGADCAQHGRAVRPPFERFAAARQTTERVKQ
jgi:hypothetical protein